MKENGKLQAIKNFFVERKYVLWLLLWVPHSIWYFVLNKYQVNSHLIHIPLDDMIPFVKEFVIFYVLWYGYIAFAHIWTFFKSKRDFLVMCSLIFTANLLSMLVCTIYPSMHDMRPDDATMGTGFLSDIVRWLYGTENPYCILPSMHCMLAIVITVGLIFSESMKGKLAVKIICPIYTVLVMLSTVFIKQHSIVDVFAASGMSVIAILLTYFVIVPKRRFEKKPAPTEAELQAEPLATTEEDKAD